MQSVIHFVALVVSLLYMSVLIGYLTLLCVLFNAHAILMDSSFYGYLGLPEASSNIKITFSVNEECVVWK
jgi:hypothetical protein